MLVQCEVCTPSRARGRRDHAASIPVWERIASLMPDSPDGVTARGYVRRARERLKGAQEAPPAKRSP